MKKLLISAFLMVIFLCSGSAVGVQASDVPYDGSMYFDGFPVDGTVLGTSAANVYDSDVQNIDFIIDTLESGTVVSLRYLFVTADGRQFYMVNYTKDNLECSGHMTFDIIEPIGAEITPAPVIDFEYTEPNLSGFFQTIRDFIYTVIDFFAQFHNCLFILFPFFSDSQVNFLITFISIFLSVGIYLLFRKVTI